MRLFHRSSPSPRNSVRPDRRASRSRRRRFAPALDALEVRALLSTLVVTNAKDSGSGSLRQTIADASSGDTITFAHDLRGQTITLTSGELEVSQDLTIDGPGSGELAVSGDDSSRVFQIDPGADVTISGLTITDGLASDGAGISNQGTLTLENCAVTDNQANEDQPGFVVFPGIGGGLDNAALATMTILGSTISGNASVGTTVFTEAQGGGIANDGIMTITNSTVSDNQALANGGTFGEGGYAFGGGIFELNPGNGPSTVSLVNSTVSDNQAIGGSPSGSSVFGGGAAFGGGAFMEVGTTLTVSGSTIDGNQAIGGTGGPFGEADGGAIMNEGTALTIVHSTLSDNQALGGPNGTGIVGDGSDALGGAINCEVGELTISDSVFNDNLAQGGLGSAGIFGQGSGGLSDGGALYFEQGTSSFDGVTTIGSLSITGSAFTNNQAIGGGGQGGGGSEAGGGAIDM